MSISKTALWDQVQDYSLENTQHATALYSLYKIAENRWNGKWDICPSIAKVPIASSSLCLNVMRRLQSFLLRIKIFHDQVIAASMLDMILHHCNHDQYQRKSYRLKDRKKHGLTIPRKWGNFLLENLTVERNHYNGVGKFIQEKVGNFSPDLTTFHYWKIN